MRLTEFTNKMIAEFKSIAKDKSIGANYGVASGEWIQEMNIENVADLMSSAMESISATITLTTVHLGKYNCVHLGKIKQKISLTITCPLGKDQWIHLMNSQFNESPFG